MKDSSDVVEMVRMFILATIKHEVPDDVPPVYVEDLKLFLDLDLSILGAEAKIYNLYAKQIRFEYGHYADDEYASGRTKVMEHFLTREVIYFSDFFFSSLEGQARENVENEIKSLSPLSL